MDIRGLVMILLNFIQNIFVWLLRSSEGSSTSQLLCDTCGNLKPTNEMRQIFGGIHICNLCINKILSLYVTTNPIRTLCPFCYGEKDNPDQCEYCDIKSFDRIERE